MPHFAMQIFRLIILMRGKAMKNVSCGEGGIALRSLCRYVPVRMPFILSFESYCRDLVGDDFFSTGHCCATTIIIIVLAQRGFQLVSLIFLQHCSRDRCW